MTKFFLSMSVVCCFSFSSISQTVTTITTNASTIDDDIIFDSVGNLFGSNYVGDSVFKLATDGTEGPFVSGFNTPNGLAFYSNGDLLVVDNVGNKIFRVTPDGEKEVFVSPIPAPSGILKELDSDTMIVTSYGVDDIWKLAPDGTYTPYLNDPDFNGPVGLCYDEEENLYIANFTDRKIFKVDAVTEAITFFAQPNAGTNVGFITYTNGYVYATTFNGHKIFRYDLNGDGGSWLGSTNGTTDGDASIAKFSSPNGIRASSTGDTLYVSDFGSKRVRMITNLEGTVSGNLAAEPMQRIINVFPNPVVDQCILEIKIEQASNIEIELYNSSGQHLERLYSAKAQPVGESLISLNLGRKPAGNYLLKVKLEGAEVQVEPIIIVD